MSMPVAGRQAGAVASTKALVAWANENGYMVELKDFDWTSLDTHTETQENADHRFNLIEEFLLTRTKAECLERAVEYGILLIPINNVQDILECPQMAYREFFKQVEHPELGEAITYPGFPVLMDGKRCEIQHRAPLIAEHNQEIYENELGISKEHLVILKDRGVV